MKSISFWAYNHLWPARMLLCLCYIMLNGIAWFVGWALADWGFFLPSYLVLLLAVPFVWAWCTYSQPVQRYRYRKIREGVVITITFLLVICLSNREAVPYSAFLPAVPSYASETVRNIDKVKFAAKAKPISLKKQLQKKLKQNILELRKQYRQASKTGKVLLIILSIIVAFGMLMVISALACNLACAGSEALAVFVAILGTGLIIFLLMRAIRGLNRRFRARPQNA